MDLEASGLSTLKGREPFGFSDYQTAIFTISNIILDTTVTITGIDVIGIGDELFSALAGVALIDLGIVLANLRRCM